MSAHKCLFIFYNLFSLRLTENLANKFFSQNTIYMFCLYHFSLKCIINENYLPLYGPLKVCIGSQAPHRRTLFQNGQDP